jgi:hypothetical protein
VLLRCADCRHRTASGEEKAMKQCFASKKFSHDVLAVIAQANEIIDEYQAAGFDLTLRQIYYQFVARGFIPNSDKEYKRLGSILNDARMAGLVDWDAINDRTRFIRQRGSWKSPNELIVAAANGFHLNRWETQDANVEVYIEKDALVGVIENVCTELDVLHFSCRGYVSQSAMYEASQRMLGFMDLGKRTVILHLGDHDPSGIDMTRDIQDRLSLFTGNVEDGVQVKRIALTMDQVNELNPPPNPAKLTDARSTGYIREYGDKSWELDAIEPRQLVELVKGEIENYIDYDAWKKVEEQEEKDKKSIMALAKDLRS